MRHIWAFSEKCGQKRNKVTCVKASLLKLKTCIFNILGYFICKLYRELMLTILGT